ncbi:EAL domain-containing protein [Ensifer adhaerens]|uniref:bifunctional diguanylate cyclase/phosphodiesterase n=1 Tax=Ensifer adhaerens TaxID=106592 RepID=UPI001CC19816|nr:EAL domain-containing protein [Ensifer adhaerens]MBZ7920729.1 EAL domain-containing protein [Ensifer adhaerens]UAX93192.1 EAL domain-containing protein [Ensifer adhaerens]UAY00829.1 EAL domain-containing protein [Ensifer adhaerens]UAY08210.1 EAL domain-containing protein [Ensifer adhaerens]
MKIIDVLRQRIRAAARFAKPSLIPAAIAGLVVFAGGYIYERQNLENFQNDLRIDVENELNLIANRLQSEVNTNIAALNGFANSIGVHPAMTADDFTVMATKLLLQNPQMVRASAAPAGVVWIAFPRESQQWFVGTDFNRFGATRHAIERASSTVRPVMIGPIRLPSGRNGFELFLPVFSKIQGRMERWGYVEAIIDENALYRAARLLEAGTEAPELTKDHRHVDVHLAIRDISEEERIQDAFFGEDALFRKAPVTRRLDLAGGAWELAAMPVGGWEQLPANIESIRLAIAAAVAIVVIPILLTGGLFNERQRNIAKLKAREGEVMTLSHRLNLALDASKIGIWEIDVETQQRSWDDRMFHLHGLEAHLEEPTYEEWRATVHPDDIGIAANALFRSLDDGLEYRSQYRVVLPGGAVRHIRNVGSSHRGADGRAKVTGISWDVTDDVMKTERLTAAKAQVDQQNLELEQALKGLYEREQDLELLSRRLDLALDSYRCGMWEANLDSGLTYWDDRMHQLYGLIYTDGTTNEETWLTALHPDDRTPALDAVNRAIAADETYVHQARVVLPAGGVRHIRSVGKLHVAPDGARKFVGMALDVTEDVLMTEQLRAAKAMADAKNAELEQARVRIEHNALHDPLTGLGNRRMLDKALERLARAGDHEDIAILHIDLDRFKQINDTLGHAAGDAMLIHASEILRANTSPGDIIARIGGDEFVVAVTGAPGEGALAARCDRIIAAMRQPVDYNGFPCRFGVSIGVAVGRGAEIDARKLLINADIALYRAKEAGRNRYQFFTQVLQAEVVTAKRIADEILEGIERDEFEPWYQPQFDATTLALCGVEALVRWNHPREGVLTPDRFLGIAEELNVTAALDRLVLEKSLIDHMRWAAAGLRVPKISVNVSAKRLQDDDLLSSLEGLSIAPGQICFELVESIFLDESDDIVATNIEGIKKLGIDIELDDFGTGHTSIVSLLKIKPKRLKIDRQLVVPVLSARREQALVRSIIEIARSLNIETVAEGVETMAHAEMLGILGCDVLQGYAFSRPLSAEKFLAFATDRGLRLAS